MTKSTPPEFELERRWLETPGSDWVVRVMSGSHVTEIKQPGVLDEVVLDHWLHLEQMDERRWWLRLGDAWLMATIDDAGRVTLDIVRGSYDDVRGTTEKHPDAAVVALDAAASGD